MTADNQKRRDELSFFLTLTPPLPPPLLFLKKLPVGSRSRQVSLCARSQRKTEQNEGADTQIRVPEKASA